MNLKASLIVVGSIGLIFLGSCSNGTQPTNSTTSPNASPAEITTQTSPASSKNAETTDHPIESKGGQVIESGPYHLEFVSEPESNGTHMDFYLQKGDNHEAIPNAKVTAQVQLPDEHKRYFPSLMMHITQLCCLGNLTYDAVLSDVSGEITFNR